MSKRPLYNFMHNHFTQPHVERAGTKTATGTSFKDDELHDWFDGIMAWDGEHPVRHKIWRIYCVATKPPKERYYSQVYWPVRTTYERLTRGWARRDVWGIDGYLDRIIPEMLECLRDEGHGYPAEFVDPEEYPGAKGGGPERWNEILNTMIRGFRAHAELCNMDYVLDGERYNRETHKPREEALEKEFKKGMKLFTKYYGSLWD